MSAPVVAAEWKEETGRSVVQAEVRDAVRPAVETYGRLDVLYNNVGGASPGDGPVTEVPTEVFWETMTRDLFGTFLMCRYGLRELIKAGGGSVVNTTSKVALMGKPRPAQDCYTIAKGGIASFTRSMAMHYAPHHIRVNAIAPGVTVTERPARRLDQEAIPR